MSKKNGNKEAIKELDKVISSILVVNDRNLKPYIEMFEYSGENIIQEQLGTLLGFFEIAEYSEYSMYVVNFLASVLKKEYFANSRRPAIESFEAALNKVNIALSELAKQGNVAWLGKINAAVCVLEKNSIHFTVAGDAKIILIRNQILSDISEDLAVNDPEPHPLKTFVNVSSGRIEKNDKFLITASSIFEIFSPIEINKGSVRFPKENFVQFIKTAMVNELRLAATFILDVSEPKEEAAEEKSRKEAQAPFNAFSGNSFKKTGRKPEVNLPKKEKEKNEYVDQKTGHIYVQGELKEQQKENRSWQMAKFIAREKGYDFYQWLKNVLAKKIIQFSKKFGLFLAAQTRKAVSRLKEKLQKKETVPYQQAGARAIIPPVEIQEAAPEISDNPRIKRELPAKLKLFFGKLMEFFSKALPSARSLKIKFLSLKNKEKAFALAIIVLIIAGPLLWKKISTRKVEEPKFEAPAAISDPAVIYAGEKNIIFGRSAENIINGNENLQSMTFTEGKVAAVSGKKILQREENGEVKEYAIPENSGQAVASAYMKDLSLLLILTDQNKIISFTVNGGKFQENTISIPEGARISGMATYLTYLYLADSKNGKIYRYPRAEGGFGEGVSWLKEELGLENVSDMAIDENIYLARGEKMDKLFKGKLENMEFEQSKTPISFNQVFTEPETANIYVLDQKAGRIIKYGKDGKITSQYHAERLKNARDLAVDEKNQKAYVIDSASAFSIDLQ